MIGDAMSGEGRAGMGAAKRFLARLWSDEHGISSVEYVLLLAIIGSTLIMGATLLGSAVSSELFEAAFWFGDDGIVDCGNDGTGDGIGDGSGQGGANTC